MERWIRRWIVGVLLVIVMLIATSIFGFFGLTFSFATLGESISSLSALAFVVLALIILPIIYGWASEELVELLDLS